MSQTFLVFDFGTDENAARQARHRIEGWKQAFRLGDKILLKFDREESAGDGRKKSEQKPSERVQLLVRLAFSDHERLSYQRWLERIPSEEPFKTAKSKVIRPGESEFDALRERFESLT